MTVYLINSYSTIGDSILMVFVVESKDTLKLALISGEYVLESIPLYLKNISVLSFPDISTSESKRILSYKMKLFLVLDAIVFSSTIISPVKAFFIFAFMLFVLSQT